MGEENFVIVDKLARDDLQSGGTAHVFVSKGYELDNLYVLVTDVILAGHDAEELVHGTGCRGFTDLTVLVLVTDLSAITDGDTKILHVGVVFSDQLA